MRTFNGELIFRFKDDASQKAKKAAQDIGGSIDKLTAAGKRMKSAEWGKGFQRDMERLGATSTTIDRLQASFRKLNAEMDAKGFTGSQRRAEIAKWKATVTGSMASAAASFENAHRKAKTFAGSIRELIKLGAYSVAGGSLVYAGGIAVREGAKASAVWEREKFRQQTANIPAGEREKMIRESERLGGIYQSVSITDIAEMSRAARGLMGDTQRGLQILPSLVEGLVALQSSKGTDAAVGEMSNLLRGIDNAGKNGGGALGIAQTREIIAGTIRAAQVEGRDFDVGSLWQFMRRAKIAGPGLSTEFLSQVAPAIIQDISANTAGTSLSSAFQAFVVGSKSVAGKKNIEEQIRLGIRGKNGLKNADLMGQNPYDWVKAVLVPALQKDGVNINNDNAVAMAVAKLSSNSNATAMITRMVQQREQIDRSIAQYRAAMGPDAAGLALQKDPFVAFQGLTSSLHNLAAAVGEDTMPTVVSGLNSLSGAINTLQQAWRDGDALSKGLVAAGGVAGIAGGIYAGKALVSLVTAGPALMTAAASLEAAAVSLGAAGGLPLGKSKNPKGGMFASLAGLGAGATTAVMTAVATILSGDTTGGDWSDHKEAAKRRILRSNALSASRYPWGNLFGGGSGGATSGPKTPYGSLARDPSAHGDALANDVDLVKKYGRDMEQSLSPVGKPTIDTSELREALTLINQIRSGLSGISGNMTGVFHRARQAAEAEMRRSFTDYGVSP